MWFLLLGLVAIALKYFEVGPFGTLSWWWVLSPFPLAMAWWAFADWSGYTKRKVIEKEAERKQERIERQRSQLGMLNARSSRSSRRRKG